MKRIASILACLVTFHSPDGSLVSIDTKHIVAVRPADAVQEHVHPGTRAVIYTGGKNFGVQESYEEVRKMEDECGD